MTRRMLDSAIWANENFASLPPMARLLQIGIVSFADDQGRMKAHPVYLRSQIFPYDDMDAESITIWLTMLAAHETVVLYEVDGKQYLQLVNWWKYQTPAFAAPSHYPRLANWQDRIRYTGKSRIIYTCNWVSSTGELLKNTCDMDGNPLVKPYGAPHGQSYDAPHGQPGEALIEDKDKDKEQLESAPTPAKKHRAAPSAQPKEPTPRPPAVVVFCEVHHRNPNKAQYPKFEPITDLALWRTVCETWRDRGYNPVNIAGQLEWYANPTHMELHMNGHGAASGGLPRPNNDGLYSFLSMVDARAMLEKYPDIKGRVAVKGTKVSL